MCFILLRAGILERVNGLMQISYVMDNCTRTNQQRKMHSSLADKS